MGGSWAGGISTGHCSRREGPTTPLCRPPLPGREPQREQWGCQPKGPRAAVTSLPFPAEARDTPRAIWSAPRSTMGGAKDPCSYNHFLSQFRTCCGEPGRGEAEQSPERPCWDSGSQLMGLPGK